MKTLRRAVHDLWCLVTDRCQITLKPDPLLQELRKHEQAANAEALRIRQRRNVIEDTILGRSQKGAPR